jgi:Lon protease-like protein
LVRRQGPESQDPESQDPEPQDPEPGDGEPLPLFPLHTVLFPGGLLPLHVFEERYRLLVKEGHDFGVVLIRHGREVGPGLGDDVHSVGTVARLRDVEALPDGGYRVVALGLHRFRVRRLERTRPYLTAMVQPLPDDPAVRARLRLLHLLERYLGLRGLQLTDELTAELRGDPGVRLVWIVGSLLEAEPAKRQQLLEAADPGLAESMLASELAKQESLGELGNVPPRPPDRN